jgi:hypothetical protein
MSIYPASPLPSLTCLFAAYLLPVHDLFTPLCTLLLRQQKLESPRKPFPPNNETEKDENDENNENDEMNGAGEVGEVGEAGEAATASAGFKSGV